MITLIKSICKIPNTSYFDKNNILWRWVGNDWVGKYAVQTKELSIKWLEEINPEDIDTRYYHLDGTKK